MLACGAPARPRRSSSTGAGDAPACSTFASWHLAHVTVFARLSHHAVAPAGRWVSHTMQSPARCNTNNLKDIL